jgi:hypothetical protein
LSFKVASTFLIKSNMVADRILRLKRRLGPLRNGAFQGYIGNECAAPFGGECEFKSR